jgi:hypothetical protein
VKLLVKLKADLGKIPTDSLRTQPGKNQRMFYVANYDIDIVVHSASLSFTLVHAGTTYQAVEAKFV